MPDTNRINVVSVEKIKAGKWLAVQLGIGRCKLINKSK